MITMDYNGDRNYTEIKGRIQTLMVFANTVYWQQPSTAVINVMNEKTKEIYHNITLLSRWTSLTNLVVMDTLQQPVGELCISFIPA